mmetsp:Transcript_141/g.161  ORF Transcript_141/g.161 Transcript_141/m.161 type:complete len:202 (-) Transcript_141:331-936(-)
MKLSIINFLCTVLLLNFPIDLVVGKSCFSFLDEDECNTANAAQNDIRCKYKKNKYPFKCIPDCESFFYENCDKIDVGCEAKGKYECGRKKVKSCDELNKKKCNKRKDCLFFNGVFSSGKGSGKGSGTCHVNCGKIQGKNNVKACEKEQTCQFIKNPIQNPGCDGKTPESCESTAGCEVEKRSNKADKCIKSKGECTQSIVP